MMRLHHGVAVVVQKILKESLCRQHEARVFDIRESAHAENLQKKTPAKIIG